jgi:hypothetical protein
MTDAVSQFASAKYLNLETFRKNGMGVRTPVWFAQQPASPSPHRPSAVFYVYSSPDAGKVKRIRNNSKVRIAPCTLRGNLRGAWVEARARICPPEEAAQGQQLLRKKYWPKVIMDFFGHLAGRKHAVIAIELD